MLSLSSLLSLLLLLKLSCSTLEISVGLMCSCFPSVNLLNRQYARQRRIRLQNSHQREERLLYQAIKRRLRHLSLSGRIPGDRQPTITIPAMDPSGSRPRDIDIGLTTITQPPVPTNTIEG